MFSNYTLSNSKFFINFFFQIIFFIFFKFLFEKRKLYLKQFFKIFIYFLSIYLYIYQNPKFRIPKTLSHLSTLNPKSRLINRKGIIVFQSSLKVRVKVISVNIRSVTMNMLFVAISLHDFQSLGYILLKIFKITYTIYKLIL